MAEPSIHVHYLYDAGGRRIKKLVRKQRGARESTVYIDALFEHCVSMPHARGARTRTRPSRRAVWGRRRTAMGCRR